MAEQKVPGPGTEGQAPYGAQQGGSVGTPAWGVPPAGYGAPQAPTGGSGLAIAALVLGVVSLLLCWVPIVNNLFAVTAIVAIVLGLVAARRAKKGRSSGRGTARAGWILGVVALVGVIGTQALYVSVLNDVSDEIDRSVEDARDDLDEAEDELDGDSVASDDDEEQLAAAEEIDAVLAVGQPGEVGDYDVVVTGIDVDADATIAAANMFNEAPAGRYVLMSLDVTYTGAEEGTPWVDLSTTFVGSDARNYGESSCSAVTPNEGYDLPTLTQGGRASYDVCFDVPVEALGAPQVYVEDTFSFDDEGRVFWAVD